MRHAFKRIRDESSALVNSAQTGVWYDFPRFDSGPSAPVRDGLRVNDIRRSMGVGGERRLLGRQPLDVRVAHEFRSAGLSAGFRQLTLEQRTSALPATGDLYGHLLYIGVIAMLVSTRRMI